MKGFYNIIATANYRGEIQMKEVDNKLINIDLGTDIYNYKIKSLIQNILLELNQVNINIRKIRRLITQLRKDINEFNLLFKN